MDQLKDFLRQCVKYRFWIAFGISLLLPMIGYFVGVGGIVEAKTKAEAAIKSAKSDIGKYTTRGIVNGQYQPEVAKKNIVLAKDVDDSWRKLRAIQEPLLRWPEEVEANFLKWGRKFPTDVDRGKVYSTLIDYTISYPAFVSKIYKIFKPFNYEDGTGIVVAPDEHALLKTATFSSDAPPDLTKVWAEQERLWVVTALLDAVAKINDSVNAKDWGSAIVKQIVLVDVGSSADVDQKSLTENVQLAPPDVLLREGDPPPPPPSPSGGSLAAPGLSTGGGPGGGSSQSTEQISYIKNDSKQYKTLPIKMTVMVDQARLPEFLVGLENSPITIEVKEAEISRPLSPVTKPEIGERSSGGLGGMRLGGDGPGRVGGAPKSLGRGPGGAAPVAGRSGPGGPGMAGPGVAGRGGNSTKGTDARSIDKRQIRKESDREAEKKAEKARQDQYYDIVEVTIYGQARFYLAPPPLPAGQPSTGSAPVPAPEPTRATAKKDDAPKGDAPATKPDAPKGDAPATKPDAPKPDAPKPGASKGETPPDR